MGRAEGDGRCRLRPNAGRQGATIAAANQQARRLRLSRMRVADKAHTSTFQFCENGAKAVTWEATKKRVPPEFFAAHTVPNCADGATTSWRMRGGLRTRWPTMQPAIPTNRSNGTQRSRVSVLRYATYPIRTWPSSIPADARQTRRRSCSRYLPAPSGRTISRTARTCATRQRASGCRNRSASARAQSRWRTLTIAN